MEENNPEQRKPGRKKIPAQQKKAHLNIYLERWRTDKLGGLAAAEAKALEYLISETGPAPEITN